jgi:hypothetical protein
VQPVAPVVQTPVSPPPTREAEAEEEDSDSTTSSSEEDEEEDGGTPVSPSGSRFPSSGRNQEHVRHSSDDLVSKKI